MPSSPDRVVVITGAASGIGAALARALARPGVGLVLHTRENAAGLAAVVTALTPTGAAVETALGDLARPGEAAALVARAQARFGRLDALVANAGSADKTPLASLDRAALGRALDAMPVAFAELLAAARPALAAAPAGAVVAVSSFVAHRFRPDALFPASAAAKAALEALVRAAAADLAPLGVTVNAVAPGYVRKDSGRTGALAPADWEAVAGRVPMRRLAEPAEIAAAIAFLIGADARYVTGQILHVDGGLGL